MFRRFQRPTPPTYFMEMGDFPPREERSFTKDEKSGTFRKVCSVVAEQTTAGILILNDCSFSKAARYLAKPLVSQHDPIREVLCLMKLRKAFGEQAKEMFPILRTYGLCEGASTFEVTISLARLDSMSKFYGLNEENDGGLLLDSVPGAKVKKLSVLIRLTFALYALNFVADIAHNDLSTENILMDTTEHTFVKLVYLDANGVTQSVVLPTYGIKPLICDFGMATQFSSTYHCMDDFEEVKYYFDGTVPTLMRQERVKAAEVTGFLSHLHGLLMQEDPLCTTGANDSNICTIDATNTIQRQRKFRKFLCCVAC